VAFNRRWSPLIFKLRQLASDPTLPKPTCYTCTFTRSKRYDADFAATAIHGLDTMRFLGGDVASLHVSVTEHQGEQPYRNYLLLGRFASGAQFQMTVLPVSGRAVERYTVIAEDVTLEAFTYMPGVTESAALRVFRAKRQEVMWDEAALGVADAHESVRCGFYQQAEHFLNGLRTGGPLGVTFGEALQSVQLMEFLRSARDGDTWRAAE
jgi:predicted dehydrogenase